MNPEELFGVASDALWVTTLVIAPVIIPALVVGLLLGMFQAATSINEATLAFVPKLLVVLLCLGLFGTAMMGLVMDFVYRVFDLIPEMVR
jgi:flagellar biosynthesis protein FliQ